MANTYKNIVITPNRDTDAANVPVIRFSGGDATTNTDINVRVYTTQNGTLSFEGSAGQLFSITNDLTGSIFSVNDVSGIPSIDVDAAGIIELAPFGGNVGIGTTNVQHKLDVAGTANINGTLFVYGTNVGSTLTSSFSQANTARTHANAAFLNANAAFDQANTGRTHANASFLNANAAYVQANTARDHANAAFLNANAGFVQANTARTHANAGFDQANTARTHANSAFATANSRVSSVSGTGTVSGLTLTGTVTTSGSLTLGGTLSASVIDNMTDEHRLFNNMGENHTTRSSFDATTPSYNFGWRYVAGSTNGPATGSQYYSEYVGLGNDYLATGAGSYGMQIAYPRNATTPYISIRYNEGNSFTAWQKISAGYADNAGTLDSIDSTQFMRTDAVSTHTTGKFTVYTPSGVVGTVSSTDNLEIFQPNAGSDAFLTFHISGDYAANFGIDGTTNDLFYGGWSAGANKYRVWHAGNDGASSGLDADLLDGQHGSYYGTAADVAAAFAKANTGGSITLTTDTRNVTTYIMFEDSTSGTLANANVSTSLTFNPSTGTLSSTIFNSTSDKTLKYDIEPIKNALVDIDTISGVKFKWVNNDHPSMGVIAQEVEKVFPELINNDNEIKTVNYNGIIAVLIQAVKELKAEVEVLKNR